MRGIYRHHEIDAVKFLKNGKYGVILRIWRRHILSLTTGTFWLKRRIERKLETWIREELPNLAKVCES